MELYTLKTFTPKNKSEVELRVAQELKNNQDFIYQTNQSLQDLNCLVLCLSARVEKSQVGFLRDLKYTQIKFENIKEEVIKRLDNFSSRVGDLESGFLAMKKYMDKNIDVFISGYVTKEFHKEECNNINSDLDFIKKQSKIDNDYFDLILNNLNSYIKTQIQLVLDKIPIVPDIQLLKKEISEKLACFKVDCNGILKEIDILKKSLAYDQKKFENIYTLIERLKADKT